MPELPGIGFEAKSDLITVMRALAEMTLGLTRRHASPSTRQPSTSCAGESGLQQPHHDDQR